MAMTALIGHSNFNLNNIHVVLNYGPLGIVKAVTEHIACDYMLVNTGTITLNHEAEVEIVMSIPGLEHSVHHRIRAQVSHCGTDGHATLSFRCCGEQTLLALLPYVTLH